MFTTTHVTSHSVMAKLVSNFSTEGSGENTMRKCELVKLGQMILALSAYTVVIEVLNFSAAF